jgi:hypothetical protein
LPHPILKKTSGPSTTGPRPTARFVSPHESEKETEPDSPVGTNSHVIVQPASPDPENTKNDRKSFGSAGVKKTSGFVASTAAKKKRPVIVRRQSPQTSQSSTDSPHPSGSTQSPSQRAAPTTSEQTQARSKQSVRSKFQENLSPSRRSPASTSIQKHRVASKVSDSKRNSSRKTSDEKGQKPKAQEAAEAGPSNRLRPVKDKQDEGEGLTSSEIEQLEMQRTLLEQANSSIKKPSRVEQQSTSNDRAHPQQKFPRSRSDNERSEDTGGGIRTLSHDSKGTTSLAPTLTTATGQLDLKDPDDLRRAFTKRPVQPAIPAVSEPTESLSRSKSQLTLLLEKDRARGSGNSSSKGRKT